MMAEDDNSNDLSVSTSAESSFGWFSGEDQENSNKSLQNIADNSDSSSENGSIPKKSDHKSFKESITIKKERYTHQLSDEEESDSPELNSSKQKIPKQCKLEEGRKSDSSNKICIDGTLDTTQSIPFNLHSDDEIWMVQCPANLDASDLKGSNIDIGGISTFGANYIGTTLSKKTDTGSNINLLIPNKPFELKSVPLAGHIIITLKVDVPPVELPAIKNKISAPLPEGLKLRHPLLGIVNSNSETFNCDTAYIKHKDINSSQTTTYSDSEINTSSGKKKKKKKKKEQSESIEMTQNTWKTENNEIEDVIESSQATKPSKYSLNKDDSSEFVFPLTQDSDGIERKKKKKRKKDQSDITESPVQDEGLESPSYFKKKKRKSDTDDSISLLNTSISTLFKKKKRKSDTDNSISLLNTSDSTLFKKNSQKSETDCSMSLLNTSISKKIAKNQVFDQELISTSHSSPERRGLKRTHSENEADSLSPKKKKKKKFKLSLSQGGE